MTDVDQSIEQALELLPPYEPQETVSGTLRHFGVPLKGMVELWEEGFSRYHPEIRFEDTLKKAAGMAGVYTGVADFGCSGREPVLTEYFSYWETFHYMPVEITVATGTYDIKGGSYGLVVFVHKDNPITGLTMEQLDGIFGAERTGGYKGFKWFADAARGPEKDIRTWGQLGLTGEWADAPITTYGYALTGMTKFFEQKVFNGGEKWNPNYREYIETNTKQVGDESLTTKQMLTTMSSDRFSIGWTGMWQSRGFDDLKAVPLAATESGTYYEPTKQNFASRAYPLARSVYLYVNKAPDTPLEPAVREYLRYVLSRDGQRAIIKQGIYFPLPLEAVNAQLAKFE